MAQEENANQILQLCNSEIARHYGSSLQMSSNMTNNSMHNIHHAPQNNHQLSAYSTDQMHNRFASGSRHMQYGAVDDMILPSGYQHAHTVHTSSRQIQVPMHHNIATSSNPIPTTINRNNMSLDILAMAADLVIDRLGVSSSSAASIVNNNNTATQPQRYADGSRKRLSPDAVTLFPSNQSTRRIVPSLVNTDRSVHASRIVHQPSYTNRTNGHSSNQVIHQQSYQPRLSTTTNTLKNHIMEAKRVEQLMKEAQMKEKSNAKIMSCNSHPQSKMTSATNNQDLQATSSTIDYIIPSQKNNPSTRGRKVGRIRRYNIQKGLFDPWENIHVSDSSANDASIRINLNRGGKISMFPNILESNKQKTLSAAMHQCKLYRQYTRSQVFHEPRFHVLLSSKAAHCDTGYMYHGINMKALPIDLVPEVAECARELAKKYNLPMNQWDIGVDMIVYRGCLF